MKSYYIVFDISHMKTDGYGDTLYFASDNCEDILHHFKGFLACRDFSNIRVMKFDTKKQWEESHRNYLRGL